MSAVPALVCYDEPAALGWLSDHQLGINYYNKYLLKELGYRDIAYAMY